MSCEYVCVWCAHIIITHLINALCVVSLVHPKLPRSISFIISPQSASLICETCSSSHVNGVYTVYCARYALHTTSIASKVNFEYMMFERTHSHIHCKCENFNHCNSNRTAEENVIYRGKRRLARTYHSIRYWACGLCRECFLPFI